MEILSLKQSGSFIGCGRKELLCTDLNRKYTVLWKLNFNRALKKKNNTTVYRRKCLVLFSFWFEGELKRDLLESQEQFQCCQKYSALKILWRQILQGQVRSFTTPVDITGKKLLLLAKCSEFNVMVLTVWGKMCLFIYRVEEGKQQCKRRWCFPILLLDRKRNTYLLEGWVFTWGWKHSPEHFRAIRWMWPYYSLLEVWTEKHAPIHHWPPQSSLPQRASCKGASK